MVQRRIDVDEFLGSLKKKKRRSKFGNEPTEVDGMWFPSKLEARCYQWLKRMREGGGCRYFLRQVPFDLPGNVRYRVDFLVVMADGSLRFIDAKGVETDSFKIKKKQVEHLYGVEVELWKG